MNCQKAGNLLSAYIEGEVSGRHGAALDAHLTECSGCREELETLREAVAFLSAPRPMARPEGMLEEFKAKYLPEAEAAAAPRWGIRLPPLALRCPRWEWPSLGPVLLPMGGMAAAAAALAVALHTNPGVLSARPSAMPAQPGASTASATRVATNDPGEALTEIEAQAPASNPGPGESAPSHPRATVTLAPLVGEQHSQDHPRHLAVLASDEKSGRQAPRVELRAVEAPRHHRMRRSHALAVASRPEIVPPVSEAQLNRALSQHMQAVPSDELKWQDSQAQIVIIQRKTAAHSEQSVAPSRDDGYAEVSCKDLVTLKVKSATIGSPADPVSAPAGPAIEPGGKSNE